MCPHGLGISHVILDCLMALPFLTGFIFYVKAKFKKNKAINFSELSFEKCSADHKFTIKKG